MLEYHKRTSEKELELANGADSSTGSGHVVARAAPGPHEYLLTRAWYMTQIIPPEDILRQTNMIISWFHWKGEIFRVPLSTKDEEGGKVKYD